MKAANLATAYTSPIVALAAIVALVALATACGGATSSEALANSGPAPGATVGPSETVPANPVPIHEPLAAPGGPSRIATVCGETASVRELTDVADAARAIASTWQACGADTLCPASDPYLEFGGAPGSGLANGSAMCGHFCSGDGGFCEAQDAAYQFSFAIVASQSPHAFELALTNGSATRQFAIRVFAAEPAMLSLSDLESGALVSFDAVGVPVK